MLDAAEMGPTEALAAGAPEDLPAITDGDGLPASEAADPQPLERPPALSYEPEPVPLPAPPCGDEVHEPLQDTPKLIFISETMHLNTHGSIYTFVSGGSCMVLKPEGQGSYLGHDVA